MIFSFTLLLSSWNYFLFETGGGMGQTRFLKSCVMAWGRLAFPCSTRAVGCLPDTLSIELCGGMNQERCSRRLSSLWYGQEKKKTIVELEKANRDPSLIQGRLTDMLSATKSYPEAKDRINIFVSVFKMILVDISQKSIKHRFVSHWRYTLEPYSLFKPRPFH